MHSEILNTMPIHHQNITYQIENDQVMANCLHYIHVQCTCTCMYMYMYIQVKVPIVLVQCK